MSGLVHGRGSDAPAVAALVANQGSYLEIHHAVGRDAVQPIAVNFPAHTVLRDLDINTHGFLLGPVVRKKHHRDDQKVS